MHIVCCSGGFNGPPWNHKRLWRVYWQLQLNLPIGDLYHGPSACPMLSTVLPVPILPLVPQTYPSRSSSLSRAPLLVLSASPFPPV